MYHGVIQKNGGQNEVGVGYVFSIVCLILNRLASESFQGTSRNVVKMLIMF